MKKILVCCMLSFFLLSTAASAGFGQTVGEVINKMLEASGGKAKLAGIKDTTLSGEFEFTQMGMTAVFVMNHKEPNKLRQEMEVMGMSMTSVYDGEKSYRTNPQTQEVEELSGMPLEFAKREALGFGNSSLLNPEKYGITHTLKGKEDAEGKSYFVIEKKYEDGEMESLWIDTETYLLYKVEQKALDMAEMETDQVMYFADYKEIDGIMFAHTMTIEQAGEELGIITVSDIKFNSGLEDSFFTIK